GAWWWMELAATLRRPDTRCGPWLGVARGALDGARSGRDDGVGPRDGPCRASVGRPGDPPDGSNRDGDAPYGRVRARRRRSGDTGPQPRRTDEPRCARHVPRDARRRPRWRGRVGADPRP